MENRRDWREANMPMWAKEAAQSEIDDYRLTAALSWPTEARPAPVPFRWGDYGRLTGEPTPGTYWNRRGQKIEIAKQDGKIGDAWKSWAFLREGGVWTTSIERGPLFESERDAGLYALWDACEKAAKELLILRDHCGGALR